MGSLFVFSAFILSLGYAIFKIAYLIMRGYTPVADIKFFKSYYIIIIKAILGIICLYIPFWLENQLHINLSIRLFSLYLVFIFCAMFLGEILDFYDLIPSWDILLHTTSGFMLSALFYFILENKDPYIKISYILFFSFCFAVASGAIWEIFEFLIDIISGANMQKYALFNGAPLVGQYALIDTMTDLIVDTLGSILFITFKIFKKARSL